jgi:hypothetical protein
MIHAHAFRSLFVVAAAFLCVPVGGCGKADSPTAVVKSFYMAANEGKYSEAEGMLAKDAKNALSGPLGQLTGDWKRICDKITKNGSITSIEPVNEEIRGEGATVVVTIHFKNGTKKKDDETGLIRQDGKWRIILQEVPEPGHHHVNIDIDTQKIKDR